MKKTLTRLYRTSCRRRFNLNHTNWQTFRKNYVFINLGFFLSHPSPFGPIRYRHQYINNTLFGVGVFNFSFLIESGTLKKKKRNIDGREVDSKCVGSSVVVAKVEVMAAVV